MDDEHPTLDKKIRSMTTWKFDFSKEVAKQVSAPTTKDVKIIRIGQPGAGMSYAAMSMAFRAAAELSKEKYGTSDKWREFFDHEHKGIITDDDLKKLNKGKRK